MSEETVEIKKPICIGLDVGTMNLVCTRSDTNETKITRNVFLPVSSDEIGMSDLSELSHIVNEDGDMFIIGEDAFKFSNIFGQEVRRPMKRGVISSDEIDAVEILTLIIKDLIGDLNGQQAYCTYSIPAEALDSDKSIRYHEKIFGRILSSLGINATPLNEAMSVIYGECQNTAFSGIGISAGAGMVNCVSGETKVCLLNGSVKTMKELTEEYSTKNFWVYSRDVNGEIVPGLAHSPRKTKSVEQLYRITLDNDQFLECTGDHKILLKNNEYIEAKNIKVNDSLSPLYLKKSEWKSFENYDMVYTGSKWEFVHRLIAQNVFDVPKGNHVHHIDGNTHNNEPFNLIPLTAHAHLNEHRLSPAELSKIRKDKTYVELFGELKANMIKKKLSDTMIKAHKERPYLFINTFNALRDRAEYINGKTFDQIYGCDRAKDIRIKMSDKKKNKTYDQIMKNEQDVIDRKKELSINAFKQINNTNNDFGTYERTPEVLKKIEHTLFKKGSVPWNKGVKMSDEQKNNLSEKAKKQLADPEKRQKMMIGRGVSVAKIVLEKGLELTKYNYEQVRLSLKKGKNSPISYDKWLSYITEDRQSNIHELVTNWNHKVKSIKIVEKIVDVYDLTVEEYHNFGLECGIFVHNCTVAVKGINVIEFSTEQSGDWIDKNVADSLNMVKNRVTNIKEKYLSLNKDFREHKNKKIRRVLEALGYYYAAMVDNTVKRILKEFEAKVDLDLDDELPIVISGGTSLPDGFIELFQTEFDKYDVPFEVSEIRHASNPMNAVSNGLLIKSLASVPK